MKHLFNFLFSHRYGANGPVVNTMAIVAAFISILFVYPAKTLAADPVRILALGDSLTAGYGLPQEQSFPARLQKALSEDGVAAIVYNAGVSGDTSAGGLSRLDWALAMAGNDPLHMVIVELGANDGLRGLDPAVTLANLDNLIGRLKSKNLPVLLTGMRAPPNLGPEYGAEFAAIYPYLAKKHGIGFYPFFLEGVAAVPELNQRDTIHPNSRGVDVVISGILPYIKNMLDRMDTGNRQ